MTNTSTTEQSGESNLVIQTNNPRDNRPYRIGFAGGTPTTIIAIGIMFFISSKNKEQLSTSDYIRCIFLGVLFGICVGVSSYFISKYCFFRNRSNQTTENTIRDQEEGTAMQQVE